MKKVTNTSTEVEQDPAGAFIDAMLEKRPGASIEKMEARGQQEFVESDVFLIDVGRSGRGPYEDLGFKFLGPVEGDDLFQYVTLPDGWKREGSDHDTWSYIVDADGANRVRVFYKAAFYDRRAHASLITEEE